jgi:hypothetical protein
MKPIETNISARFPLLGMNDARYAGLATCSYLLTAKLYVRLYPTDADELGLGSEEENTAVRLELSPLIGLLQKRAPDQAWEEHFRACDLPEWARIMTRAFRDFCRSARWKPETGLFLQTYSDWPSGLGMGEETLTHSAVVQTLQRWVQRPIHQAKSPALPRDWQWVGWLADTGTPPIDPRPVAAHLGKVMLEKQLRQTWANLTDISPAMLTRYDHVALPEKVRGKTFLTQHDARVEGLVPSTIYRPRAALGWFVREKSRQQIAAALLATRGNHVAEEGATVLGQLLLQSHEESSQAGYQTREADQMVDALMDRGAKRGIYGARLAQIGSRGCTVIVLIHRRALGKLEWLRRQIFFSPDGPWPLVK